MASEDPTNQESKGNSDCAFNFKNALVIGGFVSVGQIISLVNFVYPRAEAEKLERAVMSLESDIRQVDKKHDDKNDRVYDKLEEIRKEIANLGRRRQ